MVLFDPSTFSYDQLNSLTNKPLESLAISNTPQQIQAAQAITPESLNGATAYKIPPTTEVPPPDISGLDAELDKTYAPTANEQKYSSISNEITNLYSQLVPEKSDTLKAQETSGQIASEALYDELGRQLEDIQRESAAIPIRISTANAGRNVNTNVISGQTNEALRKNALRALEISSLMDAAKGRIDTAQKKVARAIEAKYGPIKARIEADEAALRMIKDDPNTTLQEKKRADKQLAIKAQLKAEEDKKAEEEKSIREIMVLAAKYGASPTDISNIKNSATLDEALVAAGEKLQDPAAKVELEGKRLDNLKKQAELSKLRIEIGDLVGNRSGVTIQGGSDPQINQMLQTILASDKFSAAQVRQIKSAVENGEDPITVIKNNAKNVMGQTEATTLGKFETAKSTMTDIQSLLNSYYASGGTTGIFQGNMEKTINKLGDVKNPALVDIATQIAAQLQVYRNAVSGTAYSVQEGSDIASIFPGINKTQGLNQAIIKGRLSAFDSTINGTYKSVLGKAYESLISAQGASQAREDAAKQKILDYITKNGKTPTATRLSTYVSTISPALGRAPTYEEALQVYGALLNAAPVTAPRFSSQSIIPPR